MTERIAVIGAGAWGTTLARMLAAEQPVTLWAHRPEAAAEMARDGENRRYLAGHPFPPGLTVDRRRPPTCRTPSRLLILAVPSAHVRETLRRVAPVLPAGTPVLSVVKGIEATTQARVSEIVADEAPGRAVAALSGPNLAAEIAAGRPAGTVVGAADSELATEIAELLGSDRFRVYTNPDLVGVELAGALKNVIALAAGMVDGLGLGDSGKAAIITRGLAEMTRLGVAAGADPRTFAGLAGVGDLIATCMSQLSRNRRAGELLASNLSWTDVAAQLGGVAEGETTVTGALALGARHGVELPIAEQVDAVIHARASAARGAGRADGPRPEGRAGLTSPAEALRGRCGRLRAVEVVRDVDDDRVRAPEEAELQAQRRLVVEGVLPQVAWDDLGQDDRRRSGRIHRFGRVEVREERREEGAIRRLEDHQLDRAAPRLPSLAHAGNGLTVGGHVHGGDVGRNGPGVGQRRQRRAVDPADRHDDPWLPLGQRLAVSGDRQHVSTAAVVAVDGRHDAHQNAGSRAATIHAPSTNLAPPTRTATAPVAMAPTPFNAARQRQPRCSPRSFHQCRTIPAWLRVNAMNTPTV